MGDYDAVVQAGVSRLRPVALARVDHGAWYHPADPGPVLDLDGHDHHGRPDLRHPGDHGADPDPVCDLLPASVAEAGAEGDVGSQPASNLGPIRGAAAGGTNRSIPHRSGLHPAGSGNGEIDIG